MKKLFVIASVFNQLKLAGLIEENDNPGLKGYYGNFIGLKNVDGVIPVPVIITPIAQMPENMQMMLINKNGQEITE